MDTLDEVFGTMDTMGSKVIGWAGPVSGRKSVDDSVLDQISGIPNPAELMLSFG